MYLKTVIMNTRIRLIILCLWIAIFCSAQLPDSGNLEQANDFTYTLASGKQETLYALRSEMLLLYFYNPDCDDCHALMKQLAESNTVNRLIDGKKLIVLAVYPDDDMETWNEYAGHVPQKWINGYDKGVKIHSEGIFIINQYPTLYLLDMDKKIRMKEMTFKELESELEQINNN